IAVFQLTVVILGYADLGSYVSLGNYRVLDPYHLQVTSVNPAGQRAGLRVGDIVDQRELSPEQRLAQYWTNAKAGAIFETPVHRGSNLVFVRQPVEPNPLRPVFVFDLVGRTTLILVGLLLLARGEGKGAIYAGVTLVAFAFSTGYTFNFGSVPFAIGAIAFGIQSLAYPFRFISCYLFGTSLLPAGSRQLRRWLAIVFWPILAALVITLVLRRIE